MSGSPNSVRVQLRQDETRGQILEAAWVAVHADGLASLSMRDLGARVGMKAQSLYSYFPSKHAIYDAMFRQGYEAFIAAYGDGDDAVDDPVRPAFVFFDFCTADPVRYQLLFQRTIPGFEPSPASYAVAVEAYERTVGGLRRLGIVRQADLDLWTATLTGLVSQQLANDPGGTRWRDLVAPAVAMLLDHTRREP
jgi:AcrR family transcriptional regulator